VDRNLASFSSRTLPSPNVLKSEGVLIIKLAKRCAKLRDSNHFGPVSGSLAETSRGLRIEPSFDGNAFVAAVSSGAS
jgi:hypothetical protein